MKPLTLLIAVIGLSINPVSAQCYLSGPKWENRTAAREHAVQACKGNGTHIGFSQFTFDYYKDYNTCIQYSPTQRIVFTICNIDLGMPKTLFEETCINNLHDMINRCARGGTAHNQMFTFRSDPNKGICKEYHYITNDGMWQGKKEG
ncbi:uncharacterized protein FMAN_01904 [Fusarium mangiferae]|uniref:Uncharacterized protein n=1 Tax=Fusarium mangiferae TaxID=192010 RepID=A0A1L7SPK0_FUSMA|nr:uncharacterized protein FMAN_01904 [Fusarium mangiferae]CVK84982.1 uncharacterized protein FMAN_01904 [Fusarium mangiferae]